MNNIRQYTRDVSVQQRATSMNAMERIKRKKALKDFRDQILGMPQLNNPHQLVISAIRALISLMIYIVISLPRRVILTPLIRMHRRIDSYDEYVFRELFGINQVDAREVMRCWQIFDDPTICLDNRCRVNSEEAFLIYLCRMHSFNKLTTIEREFGLSYTIISRIYNEVTYRMAVQHFDLLFNNLDYFALRFPLYNQKIHTTWARVHPHDAIPLNYQHMCGFQDGTRLEICRPGGHHDLQARCYNGNHRIHCLEFQGVSFPDGMIGDLYGPVCGARHDGYMNNASLIMERMRDCQINSIIKYSLYRDKAYRNQPPYGYAAHRAPQEPAVIDPALAHENRLMSTFRLGIEWSFGKVTECTKFLETCRLKIFMQPVALHYINAVIFANTHTCLYASQAALFHDCQPPSLRMPSY